MFSTRARVACERVVAEYELDDVLAARHGFEVSLRWLLVHMIEETSRQAGHVGILWELIDGRAVGHAEFTVDEP